MNHHPRQRRFEELPVATPEQVQSLASDHPAMLQRLPLFEAQMVRADKVDRIFVSGQNNRKIGRVVTKGAWKGMPIYTLTLPERKTCPTACHMFASCYGNAMPFARRHLPGEELEARIPKDLWALKDQHPNGFVVRLHILGDFYSVAYAMLWMKMLYQFKALRIYGYTALGTSEEQSDADILAVVADMNRRFPDQCFIRMSSPRAAPGGTTVVDALPRDKTIPGGIVCQAEREATACCATCGLCWEQSARQNCIVFIKHGMGSKSKDRLAIEASQTDASGIRKIAPVERIAGLARKPLNDPPTLLWVKPTELCVDEGYQRNLSRSSIKLITRVVQNWNWSHFKAPICVKDEEQNVFYVVDGQHTAIAAASHPNIDRIPVMIVDAESVADRARAFISHNRDRIAVTPMQMHVSAVASGDAEAAAVDAVCAQAGVRLLRMPPSQGQYKVGDTMALACVRQQVRKMGQEKTARTLRVLVEAQRAPVRAEEIKAVSHILHATSSGISDADLSSAIQAKPHAVFAAEARQLADTFSIPIPEALATAYVRAAEELSAGVAHVA